MTRKVGDIVLGQKIVRRYRGWLYGWEGTGVWQYVYVLADGSRTSDNGWHGKLSYTGYKMISEQNNNIEKTLRDLKKMVDSGVDVPSKYVVTIDTGLEGKVRREKLPKSVKYV